MFLYLKWMMIQMIQSALGKEKNDYALLRHADAVRSRMKAEWEKSYSRADLSKQKWNMKQSGILLSALILWDLSIQGGGWVGGGTAIYRQCQTHFISIYRNTFFTGMFCYLLPSLHSKSEFIQNTDNVTGLPTSDSVCSRSGMASTK